MYLRKNRFSRNFKNFSILLLVIAPVVFSGSLRGIIQNSQSHKPLMGVVVELQGSGRIAITDSLGAFAFDTVSPGSWNLQCYHEQAEPLTLNDIFVSGDAEKIISIEMNPATHTLQKMVVRGHAFRKAPDMASSTKLMNFDEILRSPGALVDVQRAVQDLPSVSSGADNTNEIIVRGGNPGENLFIMDNIEIPNPNHFADQGSGGGVISLINPLLVKGLTFSAGAPPAQYGTRASSVLDVKLRDGNDKLILGGIDLGVAGVGAHIEGPLWRGCTFMASGTKSFLDIVTHFADISALPRYWGAQTKVSQKFGNHRIYGNLIFGDNEIHIANAFKDVGSDGEEIRAGGLIYASGLSWDGYWNDYLSTGVTLSGTGNSFERLEYSDTVIAASSVRDTFFSNQSVEQEQQLKLQASLNLPGNTKLQAGAHLKRCDIDIDITENRYTLSAVDSQPEIGSINKLYNDKAYKYGVYFSSILTPLEKLKIIPGIRCDGFTFNNTFMVSPRLGMIVNASQNLDLTLSAGIQYQDPAFTDLVADKQNYSMKPKRAVTGITGIEYLVESFAAKFVAEIFYKHYNGLPIEASLLTPDPYDQSAIILSNGIGRSYGLELFVQKKLVNNVFFTAAYSYSRSEQRDFRPGFEDQWIRSDFDFRNVFTISSGYKFDLLDKEWYQNMHKKLWLKLLSPIFPLADRMEISAKWRYLGGRPRTIQHWDNAHGWIIYPDEFNRSQFDDYHRLDIRFERRYGFGFLQMIYYIDLQNVYNWENVWTYVYSNKNQKETKIKQLPFFPAGGVIIGF